MDDGVLTDVRTVLTDGSGPPPRVTLVDQLRPNVARVQIAGGGGEVPKTVIVRVGPARVPEGLPAGIGWRAAFANEVAGGAFLNELPEIAGSVPELIVSDLDRELLVQEDVGDGPTLAHLLLEGEPDAARQALLAHATSLGRIAAAAYDRTDEYGALRARIGAQLDADGRASLLDELGSDELRGALPRIQRDLDVHPPRGLDEELAAVDRESREPGAWLSYTPADACPDNNVYRDGHLRLFDFGFGGLRHLALDAAYSVIPFPTCWCYAPIGPELSAEMLAAFRQPVADVLPEAADDDVWRRKVAWACAAWFVGFIAGVAIRELDRDEQRGHLTGREAAVAQLHTVAGVTEPHFPAIATLARMLGDRLLDRWAITSPTTYPVLVPTDRHDVGT